MMLNCRDRDTGMHTCTVAHSHRHTSTHTCADSCAQTHIQKPVRARTHRHVQICSSARAPLDFVPRSHPEVLCVFYAGTFSGETH